MTVPCSIRGCRSGLKPANIALSAGWCLSEAAMALELEGNLSLERAPTRRWVSIIAVVIPVAAFVLLAAWFIRAYLVPPTVAIPSPTMMADAAAAAARRARARRMVEAPKPPLPTWPMAAARQRRPVEATPAAVPCALPMFATLVGGAAVARPAPRRRPSPIRRRTSRRPPHRRSPCRRCRRRPPSPPSSNRPSRSPVPFRCRGPSRTAASRCSPARCRCRGRGRRRSRRRRTTCRRSTATRID